MKPLLGSHRALGSVAQPTQPLPPQPEWPPPPTPTPSLLLTCMVLEEDGRGSPSGQDNGWGLGTSPPNPGHPSRGCCGPQRINGAEAIHFLWPGDRLHHTAPHCRLPYLGKFRPPHPEKAAGPPVPPTSPLSLWEAGELRGARTMQVLICLPSPVPPPTRKSLDFA